MGNTTRYSVITLRAHAVGDAGAVAEIWLTAYSGTDSETAERVAARERKLGHEAHVIVRTEGGAVS